MSRSADLSPPRKKILDTALSLFAAEGYHMVGVDQIKQASGVAKMTLYKHFPSKEALIEKVLVHRDEAFRSSLMEAVEARAEPLDRLKAVFDWHRAWFEQADFNGCMFIKAVEEFPERYASIREASRDHKRWLQALLESLVRAVGVEDPQALAVHLLIVLDGLIVNVNLFRQPAVVEQAWTCIESTLLAR